MTACSGGDNGTSPAGKSGAKAKSLQMAGPAADVYVTSEALASKPKPPVLSTPESTVRSYLAWLSYAYRIGASSVATPTMTTYEEVRIDSYVQYNLQQSRLIDQTLTSITFGEPSVGSTSTVVPAKEKWTYRYVSVKPPAGKTISGPYSAEYDTTYTVVRSGKGWLVDKVAAKSVGKVE